MKFIFLFIFFSSASCFSEIVLKEEYGSDILFQVEVSNKKIAIDEKLQITLKIKTRDRMKVNKELLRKNLLGYLGFGPRPFRLLSEENLSEDDFVQNLIYTLDPEIPGPQLLTFGTIHLVNSESKENPHQIFPTGVFQVNVIRKENQKAYLGITAPLMNLSLEYPIDVDSHNRITYLENEKIISQEKEKHRRLFIRKDRQFMLLSILILIKVLLVLYGIYRFMFRPNLFFKDKDPMKTSRERALKKMQELEKRFSYDKDYYSELSLILREYIENSYGLKLTSMTTREFFIYAAKSELVDRESREMIGKILSDADLAKFALEPQTEENALKFHRNISEFIRKK